MREKRERESLTTAGAESDPSIKPICKLVLETVRIRSKAFDPPENRLWYEN